MNTGLWIVYIIFWVGGVVKGGVSPKAPWTAPLFLVLAGTLALWQNREHWKPLAVAAAAGFAIEIIGVHTGLPFGRYQYTGALAPSFAGVPLAIAFAWLILIDFAGSITGSIAAGAVLMCAIDLLIDPVAAGPLDYWTWLDAGRWYGVPWTNFAGWILVSALVLAITPTRQRGSPSVGWSVMGFFTILALRNRFLLPAAIGCVLIPATVYFRRAQSRAPACPPSDISFPKTPESER